MAGRRSDVLDIREILRRLQLGERDRRIARDLHISRKTVGKYHEWAAAHQPSSATHWPRNVTL